MDIAHLPDLQLVLGMPDETFITAVLSPLSVTYPHLDLLPGETASEWRVRRREQMKEHSTEDRMRDIITLTNLGASVHPDSGLGNIQWEGTVGVLKRVLEKMGGRVSLLSAAIPPQGFPVRLYMDDLRKCPIGWHVARTVKDAIDIMSNYQVEEASLDHDMGACDACKEKDGSLIHCEHVLDGVDFVRWMTKTGIWPGKKPLVHSMNREGREAMELVINAQWKEPHQP